MGTNLDLASGSIAGRPPLLVYLHGLGCAGSRDWPPVARSPALAGRASLWLDLPGHGRSPRPRGFSYSLPDQARLVAALLAGRPEPIALIGHSMGGTLAVLVAELLVEVGHVPAGVLLAEPNLRAEDAGTSARVAALPEAEFVGGWQSFLASLDSAWYLESARLADALAYHRCATSLVEQGRGMLARFLALPAAGKGYILGARSDAATRETARRVAEAGVAVATVPESGHEFSSDNPAGFGEAIASLLPGRGEEPGAMR